MTSPLKHMVGFIITTDFDNARKFYADILGFRALSEDPYGMMFDANGTRLRVSLAKSFTPVQGTVLGWHVDDMPATVTALMKRGVAFEHYGLAFMPQNELGIWTTPDGAEVAWFKDLDGNTLSISKHPD